MYFTEGHRGLLTEAIGPEGFDCLSSVRTLVVGGAYSPLWNTLMTKIKQQKQEQQNVVWPPLMELFGSALV